MMVLVRSLVLSIALAAHSLAAPADNGGSDTVVRLDSAVSRPPLISIFTDALLHQDFIGITDGNLTSFLGIPFAKPACVVVYHSLRSDFSEF